MSEKYRTWIDIDLDKLIKNYNTAKSLTKAKVTCVVKANAYGHGAVRVCQTLQQNGADSFAVSCARESLELRSNGINGEILVMALTEPYLMEECVAQNVTITVASTEEIEQLEKSCCSVNKDAYVHIKVDTGFHRLGFECSEESAKEIAKALSHCPHVHPAGLFSHFGLINEKRDRMQNDKLIEMHSMLKNNGIDIADIHICDSIGLVRYPEYHYSRVRVGAFLYGVRPSRSENMPFDDFETLTFNTTVAQLHSVKKGENVGYAEDEELERDSVIATLCVGYGDGYPRCLSSGRGKVMINGCLAPVVGLVCMDQMMVDVTDIPNVHAGDRVTLVGDGISYSQAAEFANTNRNEVLSILSRRPVRVYHQNGKVVEVLDELLSKRRENV